MHCKSFCAFGNVNYCILCCQRYCIPSARGISVKPYIWGSVMLPSCFCQGHLMLFWVPYLTVTSHSPGWGEQVVCGFLTLLSLEPFNLAGSFPCKTRLHSNTLSLVPRALTATCWKHLPLTLACYELERRLNQSPGKKAVGVWKHSLWELQLAPAVCLSGQGCVDPHV